MKLEVKKIALIIAAGVISFSGAFGADNYNQPIVKSDYNQQTAMNGDQLKLKKIELINNIKDTKADLTVELVNKDGELKTVKFKDIKHDLMGQNTGDTKDIDGFIKSVQLTLKNKDGQELDDSGQVKMQSTDLNIGNAALKFKRDSQSKFPVTTVINDDKLVITIGEENASDMSNGNNYGLMTNSNK